MPVVTRACPGALRSRFNADAQARAVALALLLAGCGHRSAEHDKALDASQPSAMDGGGHTAPEAGMPSASASAHRLNVDEVVRVHEGQRARAGDVVLSNGLVRFVIAGGTESDGYVGHAGNVIDAELVLAAGEAAYDGLDELDPLVNGCPIDAREVTIERDGRDGGTASVLVTGREVVVPEVINLLGTLPEAHDLDIELRYSLAPGERALRIHTRVQNDTGAAVQVAIGDTVLFGDDEAEPYTLPGGFVLDLPLRTPALIGAAHETLPWAAAIYADGGPLTVVGGGTVGDVVGGGDTGLWQYTVAALRLSSGRALEATRYLALGRDIAETVLAPLERAAGKLGSVSGRVVSDARPLEGAKVSFFERASPDTFVAQALSDSAGAFKARLPEGDYRVIVSGRGNGEHVVVPGGQRRLAEGHPPVEDYELRVVSEREVSLDIELPASGRMPVHVRDRDGSALPAKLSFVRRDVAPPILAVGERSPYGEIGIDYVFWSPDGELMAEVPPGTYTLTASRGPRDSIDTRMNVVIAPGDNEPLALTVDRQVPALGYVAIDSHLHGMDSQHGEATRAERTITILAEGLDVHVSTDHDRIVDYAPMVGSLGFSDKLLTIPSSELTTSHSGHHNIWPLRFDADARNGGAVLPWLGGTIEELYDRAGALGGIVFQLNHGKSVFDNAGFDPLTGTVADSEIFTWRFNAMEIQNGKSPRSRKFLLPTWYALLSSGHKVAPLGVSDSHWRIAEPGVARTYVWLDPDGETKASANKVADAVVAMRTVASTGPLIDFATADGETHVGGRVMRTGSSPVRVRIAVWAPTWMAIARVRLIANGSTQQQWDASSVPSVQTPGATESARWFMHELELAPTQSTWYAVEVEGDTDLAPVYPYVTAWAHTAPIFIDGSSP